MCLRVVACHSTHGLILLYVRQILYNGWSARGSLMSVAYVISTDRFTAGILAPHKGRLRFEASHLSTRALHARFFASPEAARDAVARMILGNDADDDEAVRTVAWRRLW